LLPASFLLPNRQCFIRTAVLLPVDVWIEPILMRRKILVVEDDPDQLEAIRGNLKDAGFAVGTAANGVDALVKTRSVSPDLIVLDLVLPQLNGLDICRTLREHPATASIPVIMLTGLDSYFTRVAGFEAGINVYLTKPYLPEELVSKVEELLERTTAITRKHGKSKSKRADSSSNQRSSPRP
jgi:two-component system, OmpR family, alkaline phosphatase synthesis response regulator PhoP